MTKTIQPIFWMSLAVITFFSGYFLSEFNLKAAAFFFFAISSLSMLLIPYHRAIQIYFVYIGFEGLFKMITNYHPVVHVGAEIIVAVLTGRFLLGRLQKGIFVEVQRPPLTGLFIIHFIWFFIVFLNPYAMSLYSSLAGIKVYVSMFLLYFFGYYLTTDLKRIQQLMTPWIWIAVIQILTSIYQFQIGPSSVTWISPSYGIALKKFQGYAFRPFGVTAQAGAPCVYLFMVIPFLMRSMFQSNSLLKKIYSLAVLIGSAVVLLICQVRASIIKAIIGLVTYTGIYLRQSSRVSGRFPAKAILILILFTLSTTFILPKAIETLFSGNRDITRALERSLSIFDSSKVSNARVGGFDRFWNYTTMIPLGAGLSRVGSAGGKFQELVDNDPYFPDPFFSDNLWIALLVDLGLPGLLIFSLLVIGILFYGFLGLNRISHPELMAIHGAIFCALLSIAIGANGAEVIIYNPEASFFWFFAGMMVKIPELRIL